MKSIISYNVNGVRAAIKKGFWDWMKEGQYDIVCLQETKAHKDQVPLEDLHEMGYVDHWYSAEKKGYSGVAIFSKEQPDFVEAGCGHELFDKEGRVIRADFGDLTVVNIYFPSGTTGEVRQEVKFQFLDHIYTWIHNLKKERKNLIVMGDYNIANTEIDIHNPKSNKKTSGFLPEEREWLTNWFQTGFIDAYRCIHPEEQTYSWWSYRAGARAKDKGWRIDYHSVSDSLADKIIEARHLKEAIHSDHCPVLLKIEL